MAQNDFPNEFWPHNYPPTIDDVQVRSCWICLEDEIVPSRGSPTKQTWIHPCSCTLICHEACLLQWIVQHAGTRGRSGTPISCPQCSTEYLIVSHNPPVLRYMDKFKRISDRLARYVAFGAISATVVFIGGVAWVAATMYGGHVMKLLIGPEAFQLLIGREPESWPFWAFVDLPMVPLGLIMAPFSASLRIYILSWASLLIPQNVMHHTQMDIMSTPSIFSPPSPIVLVAIFPLVRSITQWIRSKAEQWVLEHADPPTSATHLHNIRGLIPREGPGFELLVNVAANEGEAVVVAEGNANGANGNPNQVQGQGQPVQGERVITGGMIGRVIGNALAVPYIANWMGRILLNLSNHSLSLRSFLCVRQTNPLISSALSGSPMHIGITPSWSWYDLDPVWWRNAVGYTIFQIGYDSLRLWYLWLAERERRSRQVRSKSFVGVDLSTLQLLR